MWCRQSEKQNFGFCYIFIYVFLVDCVALYLYILSRFFIFSLFLSSVGEDSKKNLFFVFFINV